MTEEKIRTGISISKDLISECDKYLDDSGYTNRSELIEAALKFFLVTRNISEKSEVLVPELAECIAAENDKVISKLSKGMFRYAVELEVLIEILAKHIQSVSLCSFDHAHEACARIRTLIRCGK